MYMPKNNKYDDNNSMKDFCTDILSTDQECTLSLGYASKLTAQTKQTNQSINSMVQNCDPAGQENFCFYQI
jgi:hypothetical protein